MDIHRLVDALEEQRVDLTRKFEHVQAEYRQLFKQYRELHVVAQKQGQIIVKFRDHLQAYPGIMETDGTNYQWEKSSRQLLSLSD